MPHAVEKLMGSRVELSAEKAGKPPPAPGSPEQVAQMAEVRGSNIRRRKKKGGSSVSG